MSTQEQGQSNTDDAIQEEIDNREAINSIMEAFAMDEENATALWQRFLQTVRKMKSVSGERG